MSDGMLRFDDVGCLDEHVILRRLEGHTFEYSAKIPAKLRMWPKYMIEGLID